MNALNGDGPATPRQGTGAGSERSHPKDTAARRRAQAGRARPHRTGRGSSDHPGRSTCRDSDARHAAPPPAKFQPDAETRRTRRCEIVELLRERGEGGLTRLDCPRYLALSMPARICELRKLGYSIESVPEQVGHATMARYVLHGEPGEKADP